MGTEPEQSRPTVQHVEENLRRNVRVMMAHRGKTGVELGEVIGVSRTVFSQRLTGQSKFTAAEVVLLAEALDTSVEVLAMEPAELVRSRCDATVDGTEVPESGDSPALPAWVFAA